MYTLCRFWFPCDYRILYQTDVFLCRNKAPKTNYGWAGRKTSFCLLDEILRGTNSDDKEMNFDWSSQKWLQKKARGAIATHDIESVWQQMNIGCSH
jgi:hypothetical protein